MAQRANGTRPQTAQQRAAQQRAARQRRPAGGEVDRYNYVDRDIYSRSDHRVSKAAHKSPPRTAPRRRKRKRSAGKVFLVTVFVLAVLCGLLFVGFTLAMGRLDRPDIDTSQYEEQPSAAPAWSVLEDSSVVNILLIGKDKGDDGMSSRSDTSMLVSIDTKNKQLKLTSFLRDMYLEIPTVGQTRLNAAYANGGAALTMQTLENNFRVNIDKYIEIDFENFSAVIDKMGGIDIDMSEAVAAEGNRNIGTSWTEGVNHLSGYEALYYARIRATDSDFGRTGRQRQVIEAIVARFKQLNFAEMGSVAFDYLPYVTTNLTDGDILYLTSIAPQVLEYEQVTMCVPNEGTYSDLRLPSGALVLDVDVEENSRLLREFLYGETQPGKVDE